MKTRTLGLMLVGACGAVASVAMADEIDRRWDRSALKDMSRESLKEIRQNAAPSGAFGDRATILAIVYDMMTNTFANQGFFLGNCSHLMEDISFGNGLYGPSYTGTRVLRGVQYSYDLRGGTASWDHRLAFYLPADVNFAGFSGDNSGMINPNATPYYTLTITGFDTNICPGFSTTSALVTLPSEVTLPANTLGLVLDQAFVEPGTPGTAPLTSTNLFQTNLTTSRVNFIIGTSSNANFLDANPGAPGIQPVTGPQTEAFLSAPEINPASVGYTHPQYARDRNFSATYTGQSLVNSGAGAPFPNQNERQYIANAKSQALVFRLWGGVESPAAPAAQSLNGGGGVLPDGISQIAGTLTPSSPFKWYKFNVATDINYANVKFLDIDTEGSSAPVSFAIFASDSSVYDEAESRGSGPDTPPSQDGNNAFQISYGVARRPGFGNGEQYSGQEGVLAAGEYYLLVAPAGAGFGDGFATNASTASDIAYSLNFNGNPGALAAGPAVSPALPSGGDLGILLGGPQVATNLAVRARGVGWVRFGLTNPIPTIGAVDQRDGSTPLSDVEYLDITQPGSSIVGEWNFALYNFNGLLANGTSISKAGGGFNGNNGGGDGPFGCGGSFAQLSYGVQGSRGFAPLDAGHTTLGRPLNNQNGSSLASDEYYLAITMGTTLFASDRWGARSTRGSSLAASITIDSDNRGPSVNCPADFNGDFGVDDVDFVIFAKAYNNLTDLVGDLNADTLTEDGDFSIFATAYDTLVCP
ncbi:MAG: hypothetical protein K2Y21_05985 [Phycisphaerales bacterium]|nr:hypothetical protein [Phycisphaerales bacterium]